MSAEVPATDELITSVLQRRIQRPASEVEKTRAELAACKQSNGIVSDARRAAARLGGLARSRAAIRYADGRFMSEAECTAAIGEFEPAECERFAAGGRARATGASRHPDRRFMRVGR